MTVIEWVQFSVLIVAIILSITLSIVILIKAIREGFTRRRIAIFVLVLGLLFITYLAYNVRDIDPAGHAQIMLLLGLVVVTGFYALSAAKQADASVKMAEEMTRPYLMLRLNIEENEFLQWDDYRGSKCTDEIPITILNAGKGPAKNIEVSLWEPNEVHPYNRKGFLVLDEKWQTEVSRSSAQINDEEWFPELREIVKGEYPGIIVVKYKDIHQRSWISYLCLERWEIEEFVMEGEQNIVELKKND